MEVTSLSVGDEVWWLSECKAIPKVFIDFIGQNYLTPSLIPEYTLEIRNEGNSGEHAVLAA